MFQGNHKKCRINQTERLFNRLEQMTSNIPLISNDKMLKNMEIDSNISAINTVKIMCKNIIKESN